MSGHHHGHKNGGEKAPVQQQQQWSSTKKIIHTQFPPLQHPAEMRQVRRSKDEPCVPVVGGVKLVALSSVLLGIGVVGVCGWVLHRSIQDWRNPTLVTANNLLSQVNTFFGGTTGLYDLDVIYRILTACSATGFAGGICQFFMSFWLLLATEGGGRRVAMIWVVAHVLIICAIGGACLCIVTNELQISTPITAYLIVTGVDFVILLPFSWVVFMYAAYKDPNTYV